MSNRSFGERSALSILVVAVAWLVPASYALADFCEDYAAAAIADAAKAKAMSCAAGDPNPGDFSGPRWDASYSDHVSWCRANGGDAGPQSGIPFAPSDETNARLSALTHCAICNDYAQKAVAQVQQAIKLKCNFTGAEWDGSIDGQMRACYAAGVNAVYVDAGQINDRDAKLRVCKRAHPSMRDSYIGRDSGGQTVVKGKVRLPTSSEPASTSTSQSSTSKSSTSRTAAPGLLEGESGISQQGPTPGGAGGGYRGR